MTLLSKTPDLDRSRLSTTLLPRMMRGFLICCAVMVASSCAVTKIGQAPPSHSDWDIARPSSVGFNEQALDRLTQEIRDGKFSNIHAVLVESDGKLIYEQYFGGTDEHWGRPIGYRDFDRDSLHDLRSISKSVTSLVLGIALAGNADSALDRPLASFFPDLSTKPEVQPIQLRHALTMTAGLAWNEMTVPYTSGANDDIRLFSSSDPVSHVLRQPVDTAPGTVWNYNGGLTQVLAGVVEQVTGKPLDTYAAQTLFKPLGIDTFEWIQGPIWHPAMPVAASGLRLRARDLAKIGSLCLHHGQWKGKQIVPASWIERATQRHVPSIGAWSNGNIWGYGYQFWVGDLPQGPHVVAGRGLGDQNIYILPEEHLVVTTFAGGYTRFERQSERILRRILAARQ